MKDEGLHEVQLNGKQLVFAFMVATVFAVVVFLLGVLVGRGLRAPGRIDVAAVTASSTADPTLPEPSSASSTADAPATAPSADDTPVSARESLTYAERLESPSPLPDDVDPTAPPARPAATKPEPAKPEPPKAEQAKPEQPKPVAVVAKPPPPTPTVAPPPAATTAKPVAPPAPVVTPVAAALAEPSGAGFVVQVMAVNTRAEADALARRLAAKGYPAFVTTTGAGTQKTTFRVRVGKYDTQREADSVSDRLAKEEQFKPWVTR